MLDLMALGLLIGQMIGRWGNFVNIEVYGVETALPWAMGIGYFGSGASVLVHPLFLYEILWNLIGFVLIYGYMNMRKFDGEVFLWYTAWYGLGRGLMEPLRNSQFNLTLFGVRIMMVLAFAMFILSVAAIIFIRSKKLGKVTSEAKETQTIEEYPEYEKQFSVEMNDENAESSEEDSDDTNN